MSLPSLALDDRTFHQLVEQAKDFIRRSGSAWTDLSDHDPGVVLLEAFAHLTETMIYRLNRVPEKAYVEFLRLIGLRLRPAAAAVTTLRFTLAEPSDEPVTIPEGVRVTTAGGVDAGSPPVFTTAAAVVVPPGTIAVDVRAYHCTMESERLGFGTGLAGQTFRAARPFVMAARGVGVGRRDREEPTTPELAVRVGVEVLPDDPTEDREPAIVYAGRAFRIWDEAPDGFSLDTEARPVYVVDRASGAVSFAPSVRLPSAQGGLDTGTIVERVPAAGREVRIWGPRGGGPAGNRIAAGALTVIKPQRPGETPLPGGLSVTNVEAATGGASAESLQNALQRGPLEFRVRERAVTALDFEMLAERHAGVARAKAFTLAEKWTHAQPGTVEIVLVPALPNAHPDDAASAETLTANQTAAVRDEVQEELVERRPLGTICRARWARYKSVSVHADLVVHRAEDAAAVEKRVLARLHRALSPLPREDGSPGWGFGVPLTVSHVYHHVLSDPGVSHVRGTIKLRVDDVPDAPVHCLAADTQQAGCWYVGSGARLFRTVNDAASWEPVLSDPEPDAIIPRVVPHPVRPGFVAAVSRFARHGDGGTSELRSGLYVSRDCGETWQRLAELPAVRDLAWTPVDGQPVLFLATDDGLYRVKVGPGLVQDSAPLAVRLMADKEHVPLYAVECAIDGDGGVSVAVAAANEGGVFLSRREGRTNSFDDISPSGGPKDIRQLAVMREGARSWLWAGVSAFASEGEGCLRRELLGGGAPEKWVAFRKGWRGGSCESLAFHGRTVFAGSDRKGVLRLDLDADDPTWSGEGLDCGLPWRDDADRLAPVDAVAAGGGEAPLLLAGGHRGVFESRDWGRTFEVSSQREYEDAIGLPTMWLFCSGQHAVTVVGENATG